MARRDLGKPSRLVGLVLVVRLVVLVCLVRAGV